MTLPDPNFTTRCFSNEAEAAEFIDRQPEPSKFIAFWDEPNRLWKVTTKANFETDAYFRGQVKEIGEDES